MDRKVYASVLGLICLLLSFSIGCGSSSSSSSSTATTTGTTETVGITATGGTAQSAASGLAFSAPLTATVTTNAIRTSGEKVTFTAPASGASGTFANGTTTETDITDKNGVATSSLLTANTTAGTFAVSASVSGAAKPVNFSLTNIATTSYSFYLSGADTTGSYYVLAGSVVIDPTTGTVYAGEQDYNDEFGGITSPTTGDKITGGTLTFPANAPPGQATITLTTNNSNINGGTETFGVQFVNSNHALITEFDGFATSSGSVDRQTLGPQPSVGTGSYAFILAGEDQDGSPVSYGGVFSLAASGLSGVVDVNDGGTGTATTDTAFTGTLSTPDSYGRGSITGVKILGNKLSLEYYIVGPETLRIIDADSGFSSALTGGPAIGSAFGQGQTQGAANTFSNASLGDSVLAIAGNFLDQFGALAQFSTSNTSSSPADFAGVGDDNEASVTGYVSSQATKVSGTYSIADNGYGSLSFKVNANTLLGFGNMGLLGIYMTDPKLNLEDPNNPVGGGGALVIDLDEYTLTGGAFPGSAGVIVPQTDATTTDFSGNYVVGWQNFDNSEEFDMIAQGTMTAAASFSFTGMDSDPLGSLTGTPAESQGDTFTGTPAPDTKNPGRYSMLTAKTAMTSVIDSVTTTPPFELVIYQASGTELFWLGTGTPNDPPSYVFFGPIEQQGSLTGLPAIKAAGQMKRKH